jgi:aminoglycoside phosphotransferase (APT) family kinase protein
MHVDEVTIDEGVVRRLVDIQLPQWSRLPIVRVESDGTENAIFRLGEDMAMRLPRHPRAVRALEKEYRWLPRLAMQLPLPIPLPLARGVPDDGFPFPWLVMSWIEGERATGDRIADPRRLATDLAGFIGALRSLDPTGGPVPSAANYGRGAPLATRDRRVRECIAQLRDTTDTDAATAAWELDLRAPVWSGPPAWIHGDLSPGNLLVRDGQLAGVIDFGGLGVGDPGCELSVAWMMFDDEVREVFRDALSVDHATWQRGRGWALSIALMYIPYYRESNPEGAVRARRVIDAVLAEQNLSA